MASVTNTLRPGEMQYLGRPRYRTSEHAAGTPVYLLRLGGAAAAWLARVGPLVGRALRSNRVTPWSASMQDDTLTMDLTPQRPAAWRWVSTPKLQGLARLFEQLETEGC